MKPLRTFIIEIEIMTFECCSLSNASFCALRDVRMKVGLLTKDWDLIYCLRNSEQISPTSAIIIKTTIIITFNSVHFYV
jgi:hypothetical protein